MFQGKSLSAKLLFGFAAVVAIATMLGVFAFTRLIAIDKSAKAVTGDCLPGVISINKIASLAKDNMRWTTSAFLADNAAEVGIEEEKIRINVEASNAEWKDYESTIIQPKDRELCDAAKGPMEEMQNRRKEVLDLLKLGKKDLAEVALKTRLRPAFNKYEEAVQALVDFNKRNSDTEGAAISSAVRSAKSGILIGLALAVAFGAGIGIFLSRSISSALNKVIATLSSGSDQVASASNQVSQSSQQMAEGASEQASSLEETSASLEEMSSMTKQNSDNSRQANSMALETRGAVEKSQEAMTRMGDAINKIKGSSDQTAKIIKTIDEIAFQTNLLALNAAVEAARAGDAGKGFAVVAEEVRNLAQRSAEAAKTTASLIEESQKNANNGVEVAGEVGKILSHIVGSVQKLSQLIGEVSTASEEQNKGIEQIGTAVTEMDKLTQSNAASAEESASASEELAAQAKELGEMVQVLVGIVKGAGASGAASMSYNAPPAVHRGISHSAPHSGWAPQKPTAAKPKGDWSASVGAKPVSARPMGLARTPAAFQRRPPAALSSNGHAPKPETVIPMDDQDLREF